MMNDTTALGALPEWDLGDLYPGQDSPELAADLTRAEALSKSFAESWRRRLPSTRCWTKFSAG